MEMRKLLVKALKCIADLGMLITISGCASRSSVPTPPINIPSSYAYKMGYSLNSTGFQLAAIDYNAMLKYKKLILRVQMSNRLVEPGNFDRVKTGYLFYDDQDIINEVLPVAEASFEDALDRSTYFKRATHAGNDTLRVYVYITELVINDAVFGTLANIPSPTWLITKPLGMGIQYLSEKGGGAVTIEIVVTDSTDGRIVAVFNSREKGVFTGLINTERFSMTITLDRIIRDWATDFMSTLDQVRSGSKNTEAKKIAPLINWIY